MPLRAIRHGLALVLGFAASTPVLSAAPAALYLPPVPPPLGAALPAHPSAADTTPAGTPAPAELANFVNELFYPQLALQLVETPGGSALSEDLRSRLDAYRATKLALQTELRAKIDTLREADVATREKQLAAFARDQTPRIQALEQAVESLRHDLTEESGFPFDPAITRDPATWRTAAYFQDGLLPVQRTFLLEAALGAAGAPAEPGETWLYFYPEGARVRVPADASPALGQKIASYRAKKTRLKQELIDKLVATPPPRAAQLVDFNAAQQKLFPELETLGNEIRRELATLQDPARPPDLPPISPALEKEITAYHAEKLDLAKSLLARVDEVKRTPGRGDEQERIREAMASYQRANAARYAALDREREKIQGELAHLANPAGGRSGEVSADVLLKKFATAIEERNTFRNYKDYQLAVLQPGLSSPQRRLLFDGALENLRLPLPAAAPPPYP